MFNDLADWLCNVMLWGAIVTLVALLYEKFISPGFLVTQVNLVVGLIAIGVVAGLSLLWPKY